MDNEQALTITVEQAAQILGIGRSTAYQLVRTGDIPSLRLGRRIVVPVAKIAERLGTSAQHVTSTINVVEDTSTDPEPTSPAAARAESRLVAKTDESRPRPAPVVAASSGAPAVFEPRLFE